MPTESKRDLPLYLLRTANNGMGSFAPRMEDVGMDDTLLLEGGWRGEKATVEAIHYVTSLSYRV
jgi:hypothetical protein